MDEQTLRPRRGLAPDLEAKVGILVERLARTIAIIGGLALVAVGATTVVSIIGRELIFAGLGPIPGDFEIVEMGCAFAIFSFMPWCQLKAGHATVDVFVSHLGARFNHKLSTLWNAIMTIVSGAIFWRLFVGMIAKSSYGETTMILQIPISWGYGAGLSVLWVLVVVSAYTTWHSLNQVFMHQGQSL